MNANITLIIPKSMIQSCDLSKIYISYKYFNMKKGHIINLQSLPKLTIEDQNSKVRTFELAGFTLPTHQDYKHDLTAHHCLKKYLYRPIQYQLSKGSNKIKVIVEDRNLGQILLEAGVATFEEEDAKSSNLFSVDQIQSLKQVKAGEKLTVLNGVYDTSVVKKAKVAQTGTYDLIELNQNLIISKDNYYFSASLRNIELYCPEHESELTQNFIKKHPTVEVQELKFFYNLATRSYAAEIVCDPEFELALISQGLGKLTLKGATYLPKQTYDKAILLEDESKSKFKGLWKNYLDIYSLIYVKNNFLAKVIQVLEGHIYKIQNMVTNNILTVELSTVICPIGQQLGAFEARQFARKQIIGKLVNVYIKKESAYSIQAMLVRLQDHEPLDKIILSEGWGSIKQDTANQSETARLKDLAAKAVESKIGLHSAAKKKVGIVRFQELTVINTKETVERARQFAESLLKNNYINVKEHYLSGVVEGFKNNDIFKIRLNQKKAIINVKIESVKTLDTKLVVKQFKSFKQNSLNYLQQHFLQRDVEVRIIEFDQKIESFIGQVIMNQTNVAETLLAQGLVYIDHSWYVPTVFIQKQQEARQAYKGVWNQLLLKLKRDDSNKEKQKQKQSIFLATVSEIKEGNIVCYQTSEAKQKLQTIIAPAMKSTQTELPKQDIKIGNICAAPFEGEFYRAKITSFKKKNPNVVEVLYIDYGNTAEVNKSELLAIPEQLMLIEQLVGSGPLLFLKKLKESNQYYDNVFDELQAILLEKQFNVQIIEDEVLLFDPASKQGTDIFHSINAKILENGLLKLDQKRLYKIDQSLSKELLKIQSSVRDHKLGAWAAYESDSEIEDDMELHISGEKTLQTGKKKG